MSRPVADQSESEFADLVAKAREGDPQAADAVFRTCRNYLVMIADRDVDCRLKSKLARSDLVQTTLVQAAENFDQFRGQSRAALFGWVRTILRNELGGTARRYVSRKRDVG